MGKRTGRSYGGAFRPLLDCLDSRRGKAAAIRQLLGGQAGGDTQIQDPAPNLLGLAFEVGLSPGGGKRGLHLLRRREPLGPGRRGRFEQKIRQGRGEVGTEAARIYRLSVPLWAHVWVGVLTSEQLVEHDASGE